MQQKTTVFSERPAYQLVTMRQEETRTLITILLSFCFFLRYEVARDGGGRKRPTGGLMAGRRYETEELLEQFTWIWTVTVKGN